MGTIMINSRLQKLVLAALVSTSLTACNAYDRLSDVGKAPDLSPISTPNISGNERQVSLPMPEVNLAQAQPNSMWKPGSKAFFRDQRAANVGDILTVNINIQDNANLKNESSRERDTSEGAQLPAFLGLEAKIGSLLPGANPDNLAEAGTTSSYEGKGEIKRNENIDLKVAALITQKLPNGNLVIQGNQQVRVNFERRDLQVAGVIRPEDIAPDNTIPYEKIAEARISYGGKGQQTDVQQPRYGEQVFDVLFPF